MIENGQKYFNLITINIQQLHTQQRKICTNSNLSIITCLVLTAKQILEYQTWPKICSLARPDYMYIYIYI